MSLKACRGYLRKKMGREFAGLVDAMFEKAMNGSYNHAMLLFELDGLRLSPKEMAEMRQAAGSSRGKRGESLQTLLVRAMEKRREQMNASASERNG